MAKKPKRSAPGQDGKILIFRMWFRHPKSGAIVRTGRPIPMWVRPKAA